MDIPPDVRKDIKRLKNLCAYADLTELRLMACLDVWVKEWRNELGLSCQDLSDALDSRVEQ